jgi:hypothetical protein
MLSHQSEDIIRTPVCQIEMNFAAMYDLLTFSATYQRACRQPASLGSIGEA